MTEELTNILEKEETGIDSRYYKGIPPWIELRWGCPARCVRPQVLRHDPDVIGGWRMGRFPASSLQMNRSVGKLRTSRGARRADRAERRSWAGARANGEFAREYRLLLSNRLAVVDSVPFQRLEEERHPPVRSARWLSHRQVKHSS